MKIKLFFIALFAIAFSFNSEAQTATPKVTKRQVVQKKKIKQGVKSGELTRKETKQLHRQQVKFERRNKQQRRMGK